MPIRLFILVLLLTSCTTLRKLSTGERFDMPYTEKKFNSDEVGVYNDESWTQLLQRQNRKKAK